ncbi:hypothetical protein AADZ91_04080 [Colwelliaceae bacterium 6441]
MNIESAFTSGVEGFQKATESANKAATDIARSVAYTPENNQQEQTAIAPVDTSQNIPNLTQSIVDLKVSEFQAKASAQVVKTADETLGTLLDVRV